MKGVILSIRFLLEVISIVGISVAGFMNDGVKRWFFGLLIPTTIVIIWSIFGAPNSPRALMGTSKFILEIVVYGMCMICFFYLFSVKIAIIYTIVVVLSLAMYYYY